MTRSRTIRYVLVSVVLVALAAALPAAAAPVPNARYGPQSITGFYGAGCIGTIVTPGGNQPFTMIGAIYCDGKDTCSGPAWMSMNGHAVPASLTGKYTLDQFGMGQIVYDLSIGGEAAGQLPIAFVVRDWGREMRGLPLADGYTAVCDLKQQ